MIRFVRPFLGFYGGGVHISPIHVLVVVRPCDGDAFGRVCFLLVVSSPLDVPVFVRPVEVVVPIPFRFV